MRNLIVDGPLLAAMIGFLAVPRLLAGVNAPVRTVATVGQDRGAPLEGIIGYEVKRAPACA